MWFPTRPSILAAALALVAAVQGAAAGTTSGDSGPKTVQQYLDEAKDHMTNVRYNDAMNAFDAAIALDASNYLTYYRRAVAYLTMGRSSNALRDLTHALDLNPKFTAAMLQRGKQLLKECRLKEGIEDLEKFSAATPSDQSVPEIVTEARQAQMDFVAYPPLLERKDYEPAIETLTRLISVCPLLSELRLKRAECYLQLGDKEMAIGDMSRAAKIQPDSTDVLYRLGTLRLSIGEPAEAIGSIKECLKYDPENKPCKQLFRDLKRLDKQLKKIEGHINVGLWKKALDELIKPEAGYAAEVEKIGARSLMHKAYAMACRAYAEMKDNDNTMKWCGKALELDENDIDSLCNRADARLAMEEYADAIKDYEKAHGINNQNRRVHEGYQKAQRLQKAAGRKDYYKILGVSRQASKKEIRKGYRKLAQEWHPDKYKGDLPKEQVLKKMSDINEAYETLIDEEKRAKVDNGEDPNEQQQQFQHPFFQQGGGFPFGGNPFGGGHGHTFRFNF
ncbi:DnaJ sub C member 3 [Irineochytrium annulatum]|nr:DnaJ sub C member 3 [Irineochytrium annulatum]